MASIEELKSEIKDLFSVVSKIAAVAGVDAEEMYGMCEAELAAFAMYISASDGTVRWQEAQVISEIFDLNLSPETIGSFIEKHNIYSESFEQTPPEALKVAVAADVVVAKNGDTPIFCSSLIDVYKKVATYVACADNDGSDAEVKDTSIYITNMIEYIKNC